MTRSVTSIPVQEKDPSGPEDSNTPGLALMTSYAPVSIGMLSLTPGSARAIVIAASVSFSAGCTAPLIEAPGDCDQNKYEYGAPDQVPSHPLHDLKVK